MTYTQEQVDGMSHDEIALALRAIGGALNESAANSIIYLAAQEGLLEKAQQAAERAHAELAETKRPLDEQMARLNQRVIELNADAERLDFLDRTNARFRMGWKVGKAPAGNVSVQSVIHAVGRVIGIREAIDAERGVESTPPPTIPADVGRRAMEAMQRLQPLTAYGVVGSRDTNQAEHQRVVSAAITELQQALGEKK